MAKRLRILIFLVPFLAGPGLAGELFPQNLPVAAFDLLAQARTEKCASCARKLTHKAFGILDKALKPGMEISAGPGCAFAPAASAQTSGLGLACYPGGLSTKETAARMDAYPELVFQFQTQKRHLAGAAPENFTDAKWASLLEGARPGSVFTGTLRLAAYRYGDGECYNYESTANRLFIQCRIQDLRPLEENP